MNNEDKTPDPSMCVTQGETPLNPAVHNFFPPDYESINCRSIEKDTDLSFLRKPIGWDLEINGEPFDVYSVPGYYHTIGGRYGNNDYWCCPAGVKPTYKNLIGFCGEAPTWGIVYEQGNYIKSKWSYTEVRRSGNCYITRNDKKFYEIDGRDMDYCLAKAQYYLVQLQEHFISFGLREWKKELIGRKIWFYNDPAIVERVIEDQGCVWIKPDSIECFTRHAWDTNEEDDHWYEEFKDGCKIDYLDKNTQWMRK